MVKLALPWPLAPILFPITEWLPAYNWKETGSSDLTAGLTVFVFLVPQGMAYALLAGMPPIYGLYSSIVPVFIYAVFGTSQQLSIGPMAITSLLLGVTAQTYGFDEQSADYINIVINLSMVVGVCLFALGLLRLGLLANLISESVLVGFLTASALVIALNQIKYIVGFSVPRFTYTYQTIVYLLTHLDHTNGNAASLGIVTMIGLYIIRAWKKRNSKPSPEKMRTTRFKILTVLSKMANFLCIIFGSIIAYLIKNGGTYIDVVGEVPSGLKAPSFQSVGMAGTIKLIPAALAVSFVAFAGNWAVAKKYASERDYKVDATQELIAEGLAVFVGAFFNCFAGSGGLARSAVNAESGAQTQLSSILVGLLMLISVQWLTSLFYYIPMSVLGAVIEISVISMIDFDSMIKAYKVQKNDCLVMVTTFVLTFFVGVTEGLFAGIFLSISVILYNSAFPYVAHIGKLPDDHGGHYKDVKRFQLAVQTPGITVIRMDSTLFFANATHFKEIALQSATGEFHSSDEPIRKLIVDASCWIDIDLTGVKTLFELKVALDKMGIAFAIAGAKGRVRDKLLASHFMEDTAKHYHYFSIQDAISEVDRCEASQLLCPMAATDLVGDIEANPMHPLPGNNQSSPKRPVSYPKVHMNLSYPQVSSALDDDLGEEVEMTVVRSPFSLSAPSGFEPVAARDLTN